MDKKGFTLVELLAVVVIIAILAGLAVPNIISMTTRAKNEKFITDAKQVIAKAKYYYKNNNIAGEFTLNDLGISLEKSSYGYEYDLDDSKVIIEKKSTGTGYEIKYSIYLTDGIHCTNYIEEKELGNNSVITDDICKVEAPTE